MEQEKTVMVYSFRFYDLAANAIVFATDKASRETIASLLGGEVLEGTGQNVVLAELDEHSRYRRVATGWVSLT